MTDNNQALATRSDKLRNYFRQPEVLARFEEVLGKFGASSYVSSVLLAVAGSEALQECNATSIISSAMRAATLRLSCDPSTGQAYLVPFKDHGKPKATLVIGYKGLYHMALRTGQYRYINIAKVHQGQFVEEDWQTGLHKLRGEKTGPDIIGWCLFFELYSRLHQVLLHEQGRDPRARSALQQGLQPPQRTLEDQR